MKQVKKNTQGQRFLGTSLLFLFISGVGAVEIPQILDKIMVIVLAFVGVIGAIKVFKKWKNGASDLQPVAMDWFGCFLMLLISSNVMRHIQHLF